MQDSSSTYKQSDSENDLHKKFFELTSRAAVAESTGKEFVSVNLYLAAYELVKNSSEDLVKSSIVGLKKAWEIVLKSKNRPMAEHLFEILSKHLSETELSKFSDDLHNLMLDKLKGLGVPIEHIADTKSASEAVDKMKNFISGIGGELKNTTNSVDNSKDKIQSQNKKPQQQSPIHSDKDSYYVRRELTKYDNLVGFDNAINYMRKHGLLDKKDSQHMQLVQRLNKEHGLNRISFSETLVFQSSSRIDANMFMEATASEIGLPCIQMHMDDNIQGSSVLCMIAPTDSNFRLNPTRTGFNGKGILMLEDVDDWDFPQPADLGTDDSLTGFFNAQMSRGIAEVINLIEVALDDPNILVMASVGEDITEEKIRKNYGVDAFSIIKIENPTDYERAAIWKRLAQDHPSLRAFSIQKLVDYSKNMSRYDIELAVHEALEDAYRMGIKKGEYIPLSIVNIVERLADHQPLDSTEYKKLEDVATADFKKALENIDDILK